MNKYHLLFYLLLAERTVSADQLDGLENLGTIFIIVLIGLINILILLISAIMRFTKRRRKVSVTLNSSGMIVILCSLAAIFILGFTNIDSGFLATCIGAIVISFVLIGLNHKIGNINDSIDNTE